MNKKNAVIISEIMTMGKLKTLDDFEDLANDIKSWVKLNRGLQKTKGEQP
jgi:hypothetical protein